MIIEECNKIKDFFKNINMIAYKTDFVKRCSKLNATNFIKVIIESQYIYGSPSLDNYSEVFEDITGKSISRQGIDDRINEQTNAFLLEIINHLLSLFNNEMIKGPKLLSVFNNVHIIDSTNVELNEKLKDDFKGSGGCASLSALKVQTMYSFKSSSYEYFDITSSIIPDNKYPIQKKDLFDNVRSGDLLLQDLGYFSKYFLNEIYRRNAYYLSRFPITNTNIYLSSSPDNKIDISSFLESCVERNIYDVDILITNDKIPTRLIILPIKEEIANERIRKKGKELKKKGKSLSKRASILFRWCLMITNAPREKIKPRDIYNIYRVRWSIELVFKLWKSKMDFENLKGFHRDRVLFELYSKLISIIFLSLFNYGVKIELSSHFEISLIKSFDCFKRRISKILYSITFTNKLLKEWLRYKEILKKHGQICKSNTRKTTLSRLEKYNKGGYKVFYELDTLSI